MGQQMYSGYFFIFICLFIPSFIFYFCLFILCLWAASGRVLDVTIMLFFYFNFFIRFVLFNWPPGEDVGQLIYSGYFYFLFFILYNWLADVGQESVRAKTIYAYEEEDTYNRNLFGLRQYMHMRRRIYA